MIRRATIQLTAYLVFFATIYYFSTSPAYHYLQPGQAEVKLAFKHTSQREQECHKRTQEEMMKLPPNMRRPQDCPRQRAPIYIELLLDDRFVATRSFPAPGLSHDMATFVYSKHSLPAGQHKLTVRMRDSIRKEGFDYSGEAVRDWQPGQSIVIGFQKDSEQFTFE
ncbi:MAG: hypothetical protein HQM03_11005 [Magnetococcales bacterium]|nr:hypothetical protein [Magnetococcales bacterium]